jgi:hypothetical protein
MFNMKWIRRQRGQAMAEYQTLIPIGVMIAITAGLITGFLGDSFKKTIGGLETRGIECEAAAPEDNQGPTLATMGNHTIRLTASVYNPEDDTTTVTYTVTSGASPSISHWVLGLPQVVADNILEVSEQHEWTDADPTTGTRGIKFDTGYEVGGGGSGGGGGGHSGGKGGGKSALNSGIVLTSSTVRVYRGSFAAVYSADEFDTVSREITLLISGNYDWGTADTSIKAGTDTYTSTIRTPIVITEPSEKCE